MFNQLLAALYKSPSAKLRLLAEIAKHFPQVEIARAAYLLSNLDSNVTWAAKKFLATFDEPEPDYTEAAPVQDTPAPAKRTSTKHKKQIAALVS